MKIKVQPMLSGGMLQPLPNNSMHMHPMPMPVSSQMQYQQAQPQYFQMPATPPQNNVRYLDEMS